jgi:hypothetical protein
MRDMGTRVWIIGTSSIQLDVKRGFRMVRRYEVNILVICRFNSILSTRIEVGAGSWSISSMRLEAMEPAVEGCSGHYHDQATSLASARSRTIGGTIEPVEHIAPRAFVDPAI